MSEIFFKIFTENQKVNIFNYIKLIIPNADELQYSHENLFRLYDQYKNSFNISDDNEDIIYKSENTVAENTIIENTIIENTISENTISENTISENTVSENTVSENTITENTITEKEINSYGCCCNFVNLPEDTSSGQQYTITESGNYCLQSSNGNIQWTKPFFLSIISSNISNPLSDIVVDLNNTTIIQNVSSIVAPSAIRCSNAKNITICNGTFIVNGRNTLNFTNVTNVKLINVKIISSIETVSSRSLFDNTIAFTRGSNILVDNCVVNGGGSNGISFNNCDNGTISNCTVSNKTLSHTVTDFISLCGIYLSNSTNIVANNNTVFNLNILSDSGIGYFILGGIGSLSSTNVKISDSTTYNLNNNSGICYNFFVRLSTNAHVSNCKGYNASGRQTTVCFSNAVSDTVLVENCIGYNAYSTCQDAHGITFFISNNGTIRNCSIDKINSENPSGGYTEKSSGIEVFVSNNCVVENCNVSNIRAVNPLRHNSCGIATGNSTNIIIKNCVSKNSICITNYGEGRGVGFGPGTDSRFIGPSIGTIWENCIAQYNVGISPEQSIGFDLYGQQNSTLTNCKSLNNGIGVKSGKEYDYGNAIDIQCNTSPIIVPVPNDEHKVLVYNNIISGNTYAGIYDKTKTSHNCYLDNVLFNNRINEIISKNHRTC
jgi:hypothetical protein